MAECIVLKGGGGADLDVITAGAGDVLAGKVTVDREGNPLPGTMPNRGTSVHGAGVGLNGQGLYYYIPKGYYDEPGQPNPWVYMTRAEIAASLGIEPWKMRGDVNICGVQGGIPIQGDETGGGHAWNTAWGNWGDGNIFMGVRNGYLLNGVNWIRAYIENFWTSNIKRGVNIGGVVGTFEGYVANPTDLYNRGAWGIINSGHLLQSYSAYHGRVRYDSSQIAFVSNSGTISPRLLIGCQFDVTRYSSINFIFSSPLNSPTGNQLIVRCGTGYTTNPDADGYARGTYDVTGRLAVVSGKFGGAFTEFTITMDLTNINTSVYFVIEAYVPGGQPDGDAFYIKRMWFN